MKIAGIICEYNPFHNGHKYQIELLKKEYDAIVCIMSGSFVQRGDVAIYDKWTRTKAALSSGCDLVIELAQMYALSSAQGFAKGAVDILSKTGVIDALSFGSECGDIDVLTKAADILLTETEEVSLKIKENLKDGMSYPSARQNAYKDIIDAELLSSPNNILALEYIMEIKKQKSKIIPITHTRSDSGYHSMDTDSGFASATKIREMIKKGENIADFVPYDYTGCETYDLDRLSDIFKYILIRDGISAFSGIPDMEPGLDNRFIKSLHLNTISEIIDSVKTKRYTKTRLNRIVCRVLLGIKTDSKPAEYIRILGMSEVGKSVLSDMKKKSEYPIINKVADFDENLIKTDILATDISAMCSSKKIPQGRDFTTSPVII